MPFTMEELNIISQMLRRTQITGTIETLPAILQRVAVILQKIDAEFEHEQLAAEERAVSNFEDADA